MTTTDTALHEADLTLLALMAKGLTGYAIACRLDISDRTLRRRTRELCERLDVHTPIEAVVWAAKQDLI